MSLDESKIAIRNHKNWLRKQPYETLLKSYRDEHFRRDFLFEDPFLQEITFDSKITQLQKVVRYHHLELIKEIFSEMVVLRFIKQAQSQSFFMKYPHLQNDFAKIAARQTYLLQNYGGGLRKTPLWQKLYWLNCIQENDQRTKDLWRPIKKEEENYVSYMLQEYHGYLFIYYQ